MSEERLFEENLWLPTLYLVNLYDGIINTSELNKQLRNVLNLSDEDLEIINGRSDDYFSQIVRNLTASTRPFIKEKGLITREPRRNSPLFITDNGRQYLLERQDALTYLLNNNFKYEDINENIQKITSNNIPQVFDENIKINEGNRIIRDTPIYQRSKQLRDAAIEQYSHNGKIDCKCCSFDFQDFYGEELGKGFIEIHHIKPIFKYEDTDIQKTIDEALNNLIPICPNCHSIIHRGKKSLEINSLRTIITSNGLFPGYKKL